MKKIILACIFISFFFFPAAAQNVEQLSVQFRDLLEQQKYDSAILIGKKIAIETKAIFGETYRYANFLNDLGYKYKSLDLLEAAKPLYIEAAQIYGSDLGEQHPFYATSLFNLAELYVSTEEYEKAASLHKKALEIRKIQLGKEHAQYAISLNNLARVYKYLSRYSEAEPLYKEALIVYEVLYGKQHYRYASCLQNLAQLYQDMNRLPEAEPLFQEALKVWKIHFGEQNANYGLRLLDMATLYAAMDRKDEAVPLFKEALEILKTQLGTQHSFYQTTLSEVAEFYESFELYEEAEALYEEALQVYKTELREEDLDYAFILEKIAALRFKTTRYEEAETAFKQALKLFKTYFGEQNTDYGFRLFDMAALYVAMDRKESAVSFFKEALKIFKTQLGPQDSLYLARLDGTASFYNSMKLYDEASILYEEALQHYDLLTYDGVDFDRAIFLSKLANTYVSLEKYEAAEPLFEEAIEILRRPPFNQQEDLIANLMRLGSLYETQIRHSKAISILKEALEIQKENNRKNDPNTAAILRQLAILHSKMDSYERAEKFYRESLKIMESLFGKYDVKYVNSLISLMSLHTTLDQYDKAEKIHKEIFKIYRSELDTNNTYYANYLTQSANLYREKGEYFKAEHLYEQALHLFEIQNAIDNLDYAHCLSGLAYLYIYIGRLVEAESLQQRVMYIYNKVYGSQSREFASQFNEVAALYHSLGRFDEAENAYLFILGYYFTEDHEKNSYEYATIAYNLATLYKNVERYTEAENLCKKALTSAKQLLGETHEQYALILIALADIYKNTDRLEEAERYYIEGLDILTETLSKNHLNYLSRLTGYTMLCRKTGQFETAEKLLREALQQPLFSSRIEHNFLQAKTNILLELFRTLTSMERPEEAFIYLKELLEISKITIRNGSEGLTEKERSYLKENYKTIYDRFFSFLEFFKTDQGEIAYNYQLFYKNLVANSQYQIRQTLQNQKDTLIQQQWEKYKNQHAKLSKWYNLSENQLENQGIKIRGEELMLIAHERELAELAKIDWSTEEVEWKDIQKKLAPNEAAVEISRFRWHGKAWTDSVHYAVMILKKDSKQPAIIYLTNGNDLEKRWYSKYLESRFTPTSDSLYQNYWAPVQKALDGINKVFLSADGIYNQLNLDILSLGNGKRYLSDSLEIVLVPSSQVLIQKDQYIKTKIDDAVLIGGIDYNGKGQIRKRVWTNLDNTIREVKNVQTLLQGQDLRSEMITGLDASEKNILDVSSPDIVHFATHGFFYETNYDQLSQNLKIRDFYANMYQVPKWFSDPLFRSGLVLAEANALNPELTGKDGLLTAYEIAVQMDLRDTRLAVLSGCDTGKGVHQYGEGIYGLQRAFQIAGAQSLIMSLWPVQDQVAEEFFTTFYIKWLTEGMDKRAAFKAARDQIREDWEDPGHWGGFIMLGL